jgi:hypothetical protein
MKRILYISMVLLMFTACAGVEQKKTSLSEDMGSPEKVALLKQRATEYWTAFVAKDYNKVYSLNDPFFRARMDMNSYLGKLGTIIYYAFEIKDIKVEGNVATVKVKVDYSIKSAKTSKTESLAPESTAEFEGTWLYVYDNWYTEYRGPMIEIGIVEY